MKTTHKIIIGDSRRMPRTPLQLHTAQGEGLKRSTRIGKHVGRQMNRRKWTGEEESMRKAMKASYRKVKIVCKDEWSAPMSKVIKIGKNPDASVTVSFLYNIKSPSDSILKGGGDDAKK